MKVGMSPEAISRRLRQVGELVEACRALRIVPGKPGASESAERRHDPAASGPSETASQNSQSTRKR